MNKFLIQIYFFASALCFLISCGPGSSVTIGADGKAINQTGSFFLEGSNLQEGSVWQLNRPIRLEFNHAVDPTSINFGSIQIHATDRAEDLPLGVEPGPVTGTFELEEGTSNRVVLFRPACPTDEAQSNGAFSPDGVRYEIFVPTRQGSTSVLRDSDGRSLEVGMRRSFSTPQPSQQKFMDRVSGGVIATSVSFPSGLNLFTDPNPTVEIQFNQAIDSRASNLNTSNLTLYYSEGEVGSAHATSFPLQNRVPGTIQLAENCTNEGALVHFRITGILPVNRNLSLRLSNSFRDIVGQTNSTVMEIGRHTTPKLSDLYADSSWSESDLAVDEFHEDFEGDEFLDLDAALPVPTATIGQGFVAANFGYPGRFVPEDSDVFLAAGSVHQILTDSQVIFFDSNQRQHTVINGVINVNDLVIEAGATLRGRGTNPLIIYATGKVEINGTINVSGNNAVWPISLNSPQFIETGARGECGGGDGGDASHVGNAETPRAQSGKGAFNSLSGGGQGGEGGFRSDHGSTGVFGLNATMVGGGAGGAFARTLNEAVLWTRWPLTAGWHPETVDNSGPDHIISRHTGMILTNSSDYSDFGNAIYGAEDGLRGSAATINMPGLEMIRGMEDGNTDGHPDGDIYDPAWTLVGGNSFYEGHPNNGPDGGNAGISPFTSLSLDRRFLSDFYGRRLMANGDIEKGSLGVPWAGSGGGGGGDSMLIQWSDVTGNGLIDPIESLYPVTPFQQSLTYGVTGWTRYRKGAGGGGGGGQLIIMCLGDLKIGATGLIQANGGIGYSGESMLYTYQGISGSGGGSGGHVILHTSANLDLSDIYLGTAATANQVGNLLPLDNIQAIGGRRGWAGPIYTNPYDGNQTFATGRGGAGGNGIIQVHVNDPTSDIIWHSAAAVGIAEFISQDDYPADHVEEVLNLVSAPTAYSLLPFFAGQSMLLSKWIDTGVAEVRRGDSERFPDFGHDLLRFEGTSAVEGGRVLKTEDMVTALEAVATGLTSAAEISEFQIELAHADQLFAAQYLRAPQMLVGYDFWPSAAGSSSYEISSVAYDKISKVMLLTTQLSDGPVTFGLNQSSPQWQIRKKFFRLNTSGLKDSLPSTTQVYIEFQVADAIPGTDQVGEPVGGLSNWLSDLRPEAVAGRRFIRYRVLFDANADPDEAMTLSSPLPVLENIKIPIVW